MNSDETNVETLFGKSSATKYPGKITYSQSDRRLTKKRLSKVLLALYLERNDWKKYGELQVYCKEFFILAPVKLWWWMHEIFMIGNMALLFHQLIPDQWVMLTIFLFFSLLELLAFFKTCLRDPGILPRADFNTAFKTYLQLITTWERGKGLQVNRVVSLSNGITEHQAYCWKCHHFRNYSTSHCAKCDCCMIQHDHHCPVYGGCVARNNLKAFYSMVATCCMFWLLSLGYGIYGAFTNDDLTVPAVIGKPAKDGDPKIILYVVLSEIAAVIIFPPIFYVFKQLLKKKKKRRSDVESISHENYQDIIAFAYQINLSTEDINGIKRIFDFEDNQISSRRERTTDKTDNDNGVKEDHHNQNFHSETE